MTDNWKVYIIQCSDGTLYTGVTTDMEKRLKQHRTLKGAKYFRGRHPDSVVYLETGHNRSTACKKESALKKMTRAQKLQLIRDAARE